MACSAIVLCGGRGSRVNGADKGLLEFDGRPLVASVLSRIEPQVDDIVISANRNLARYRALGHRVVADTMPDFAGPLAGILSALPACHHERVLVTACDTPFLPDDLATRLLPPLESCDLAYAWDGEREQYLSAALHRSLAESLAGYLADGQRSVHGWYGTLNYRRVDFSDEQRTFQNINTLPGA